MLICELEADRKLRAHLQDPQYRCLHISELITDSTAVSTTLCMAPSDDSAVDASRPSCEELCERCFDRTRPWSVSN
jgi:hypothetical protein